MPNATPLPRPDLEDLTALEIFTNSGGLIDGDKLQRVLLYIIASAPNLLTDGLLTGNAGAPVNVDYLALLRAIQSKAEQSFVVDELTKKENKFTGLLPSELDPTQAAFAGLLLRPLLIKIVNALGATVATGGAGVVIIFLPDGRAILSPAAQTLLDAGELYWLHDDGSGYRTTIQASQFGVSPNNTAGGNATGVDEMRSYILSL